MTIATGQNKPFAREQLQQWGVLSLMALLLIGIALFIFLVLLPDLRRRAEYAVVLTAIEGELRAAQLAKAEAPLRVQAQLVAAEGRLNQTAEIFLNEAESAIVVNRLYTYADAAAVEIVNLQAAPPNLMPTHSQRDYRFQVVGEMDALLDFLGRIEEVNLPGFVVYNVAITTDPVDTSTQANTETSTNSDQHTLVMNVSIIASPYSTRTVIGSGQDATAFGPAHRNNIADLPIAEVQRQVELAWSERNWQQAIDLLRQVTDIAPDHQTARIALYRAYVNNGYAHLTARDYDAARLAFENATAIDPVGHEAGNELRQLVSDGTLSHRVEDELRQDVEQAKVTGNWQEVIRLLRIIAAVDPAYGPVGDELNQAYINYGNQLASGGDSVRAAEQYQLAQYTPPNQSAVQTNGSGTLVNTPPVTGTVAPAAP